MTRNEENLKSKQKSLFRKRSRFPDVIFRVFVVVEQITMNIDKKIFKKIVAHRRLDKNYYRKLVEKVDDRNDISSGKAVNRHTKKKHTHVIVKANSS